MFTANIGNYEIFLPRERSVLGDWRGQRRMVCAGVQPVVARRECSGWLAVAPEHAAFRLCVVTEAEAEPVQRFNVP